MDNIRSLLVSALLLTFFASIAHPKALCSQAKADRKPMVVVISLDAFGYESLRDPYLPAPTLRSLMRSGAYASMQPVNPTVTWPNHTAMVTGVDASQHHVLVNGLIVDQRSPRAPHIDADAPKSQLVAVPTVYDAAHAAGLTTAEVDWVAITKAESIDWSFAEKPDPQSKVVQEMLKDGLIQISDLENFFKPSQAWRDRIYTNAAIEILRKHHPNLLLVHLLALDGIEHQTGFGNDSGRNTIAFLDDRVKEIMEAVRAAGDLDRTTFLIVSDHGQQTIHHQLHPNVLLREAHFQDPSAEGGLTFCLPEGGSAMIYQEHATTSSIPALKRLFEGKPGVRSVLTAEEAAQQGYPLPSQSNQAPDLLLFALDDYSFSGGDTGEYETTGKETGGHGYPNTNPLMQEIFIASGAGITKQGEIPAFPNLNVAPTIARLLGISLENTSGNALAIIAK